MRRIYAILIAIMALINLYLFRAINTIENKVDTTDDIVINNTINSYSTEITDAVNGIDKHVVRVTTADSRATGFIYSYKDGVSYIVTAAHALGEEKSAWVTFTNYRSILAEVVGKSDEKDIAVLKCQSEFDVEPIKIGNNNTLKEGEFVIAVGATDSFDYQSFKSIGIVSSKNHFIDVNNSVNSYIVSDNRAKEGYSGGPLINLSKEIIGVCLMGSEDSGNIYSLTINEVKLIAEELINENTIHFNNFRIKYVPVVNLENYQKSSIGISADVINGLYVYESNNTFDIKKGDIILSCNEKNLNRVDDFMKIEYSDETQYDFTILRNGEELHVVTLMAVSADD